MQHAQAKQEVGEAVPKRQPFQIDLKKQRVRRPCEVLARHEIARKSRPG